jgi:uncharacterized protein (DUF2384 family)
VEEHAESQGKERTERAKWDFLHSVGIHRTSKTEPAIVDWTLDELRQLIAKSQGLKPPGISKLIANRDKARLKASIRSPSVDESMKTARAFREAQVIPDAADIIQREREAAKAAYSRMSNSDRPASPVNSPVNSTSKLADVLPAVARADQ